MTWRRVRLMRMMTMAVPAIWFLYVVFTIFTLDKASTRSSQLLAQEGHGAWPDAVHQEPAAGQDAARQHATGNDSMRGRHLGDMMKEGHLLLDNLKQGVAHMDVNDVGKDRGRGDESVAGKGRGDVRHDVKVADDVDPYADVAYPPYVETLPSGAKGQGPDGLQISVETLDKEKQKEYKEKWNKNQFSQYVSDLIPVHRELPDYRTDSCKSKQYPANLPTMSVVIVFHNEAWSTLLRSVHSVLDRTSHKLLRQIILVDDFSDMDHLKRPLDKYFYKHSKVKIVRLPKRGGLIQARLRGFDATTGEVVVFLDSHIECTPGWAEPLLWPILEDYRTVPFPLIDMIHPRHLRYMMHHLSPYGVFNINSLTFTWSSSLRRDPNPKTGAKPSPTMPGGLFAISRKWFLELGTFDPELEYWGGENMELSFKTWMCGGSIVIAECSHIGHIFRGINPITWSRPLGHRNYIRVAMVWMDEYKNHYLERFNYHLGDYGDVSARVALRKKLKCHSFGWYVDNVYPELMEQIVLNATYAGEIRHEQSGLCLDKMAGNDNARPQALFCHRLGSNQFWYYRDNKYLQSENRYLCKQGWNSLGMCYDMIPTEQWNYNQTSHQLVHVTSSQCLEKGKDLERPQEIHLAPCNPSSHLQKWSLQRRQQFKYR